MEVKRCRTQFGREKCTVEVKRCNPVSIPHVFKMVQWAFFPVTLLQLGFCYEVYMRKLGVMRTTPLGLYAYNTIRTLLQRLDVLVASRRRFWVKHLMCVYVIHVTVCAHMCFVLFFFVEFFIRCLCF